MSITALGKIVATVLVGLGLTGCVDVTVDVALISDTTAKATTTLNMGAEFHTILQTNAAQTGQDFCAKGTLSENKDGSAICILVSEAPFADLILGTNGPLPVSFTPDGPGLIRIALTSAAIVAKLGDKNGFDAETQQMMQAFTAGRKLTIRFAGVAVTDTNMTLSTDKTSAQTVIPLLDLMQGKTKLPEEFYAVVGVP